MGRQDRNSVHGADHFEDVCWGLYNGTDLIGRLFSHKKSNVYIVAKDIKQSKT